MIGLNQARVRFGTRTIFEDLTFSVPRGECMAILGPNGRGKTTALRAMLGFQRLDTGQRQSPAICPFSAATAPDSHSYQ